MDGTDENCGKIRNNCKRCQVHEAVFKIFISRNTKRTFGKSVYCGKFYCQCIWAGVGGYACWGLSYNSEWLKKSLKKSRIFTDLVLLKNVAFNQKVEIFRLDGADSKKN